MTTPSLPTIDHLELAACQALLAELESRIETLKAEAVADLRKLIEDRSTALGVSVATIVNGGNGRRRRKHRNDGSNSDEDEAS